MNTFTLGACFQHELHTGPYFMTFAPRLNPLSGNSSRADERNSLTSTTSWFMLLYWISEFFPFDRGPAAECTRAGPRFQVIINISQLNTCIIYASFPALPMSHGIACLLLPFVISTTHCGDGIEFSRGTRDQVNWFTPPDKVRGIAEQSILY